MCVLSGTFVRAQQQTHSHTHRRIQRQTFSLSSAHAEQTSLTHTITHAMLITELPIMCCASRGNKQRHNEKERGKKERERDRK